MMNGHDEYIIYIYMCDLFFLSTALLVRFVYDRTLCDMTF